MSIPDAPETTPETEPAASADPAPKAGPDAIKHYLKTLPGAPGVYRMIDDGGDVLYVGKARNLRNRVSSYANRTGHSNRIARMIAATATMEFVVTESETEALLLEANLIKRLKPRYNISYRDDKSFPYILVAADHDAPQVLKHRGARKRKGNYFGPFASAGAVNRTLNTLQKAFLLRSCSDSVYEARTRPCLLYQIKRCAAPCVGHVSLDDYAGLVNDALDFLNGRNSDIQSSLSTEMERASEALDFERAAALRDRIRALTAVQERQGVNPQTLSEADVFAIHSEGGQSCVQVFFFRSGQNWGNRSYFPRHDKDDRPEDVLDAFLAQFYDDKPPPRLVLVDRELPNQALLEEALSVKAERRVSVSWPQRGEKSELIRQTGVNAREALGRRLAESASQRRLLEALGDLLGLEAAPERIEVYDNSHIQGDKAVGAMVVAGPDGFEKGQYRKFNIKSEDLAPGDDYGMMREVLTRRFSRLLKEDGENGAAAWPDLVLVDGGKGQLSAARQVFDDLGVESVALAAVAKARMADGHGGARADRSMSADYEQLFAPGRPDPILLEPKTPVLYFIQRLRDESHRFAIGSHRARRKKAIGVTRLDDAPGVGSKRKRALLNHFGSARAVAQAKVADLAQVEGVSRAQAQKIYDFFHAD